MRSRKKLLSAIVAALAVIGVGTGIVFAAGGDDDKPLRGDAYDRATAAAIQHMGGGSVIETEVGDDGAAYGVEIRKDDGSVVEVSLDETFEVIGMEKDEDHAGETEEGSNDD